MNRSFKIIKIINVIEIVIFSLSIKILYEMLVRGPNNDFLKLANDFFVRVVLGNHIIPVDPVFHEFPEEI